MENQESLNRKNPTKPVSNAQDSSYFKTPDQIWNDNLKVVKKDLTIRLDRCKINVENSIMGSYTKPHMRKITKELDEMVKIKNRLDVINEFFPPKIPSLDE